ncbi:MAG: hypothetical protein KC620_11850 [Myxococcales bacterium]|nr:hypothetical protein [Myxococcales bacterium]
MRASSSRRWWKATTTATPTRCSSRPARWRQRRPRRSRASTSRRPPRELLGYKTNHDALLTSAREQITAAQALLDDAAFFERIELAGTSYPDAKVELDKRRDALQAHARQIVSTGGKLEAVAAAQPPQYIEVGSAAEAISTAHGRLVEMKAELESDLASLQTSIDRVLIDMKEDGGRYYHKYRVIENGASRETDWQEVTRSVYQQHREHLGMAIYSKPEGKLASQAETIAAPPGYAYVGNTRYGYWEQRNGQSFWVFYGKYALMRDLLWGPGRYRPVIQGDYRTYRRTVSSGQSWFGKNKEFGSKGTETKARYAGSKYFQQQSRTKYSSSKYQGSANRTAGRYSGSKYQGGAPSSGRYSGSRYSSSPSRSFSGSRGSRFRGSSFGGFGK